jgi:uncharacterized membrane protein
MPELLRGYAIVSVCGWAVFPLVRRLFSTLPDQGYAACRCFGWAVAAWLAWMVAWATGRPLTTSLAQGSIALIAVSCWGPGVRRVLARRRARSAVNLPWKLIACTELLLIAGLLLCVFLEKRNPAVDPDSERFMDYAFLRGCLRSTGLPLVDPWMAGKPAAYYHFGYALVAFLMRAGGAEPATFLSTAIALPYALLWVGVFGLGVALTGRPRGGFWAAFMTLGAGNLEWVRQGARALRPEAFDWFASSRVIEGTITEVPWFSLLWGDLHPYVLALPIVVCALALVVAAALEADGERAVARAAPHDRVLSCGRIAALAILSGAVLAVHPWDYPLLIVSAIAITLGAAGAGRVVRLAAVALAALLAWPLFTPFLEGLALGGHGLGRVTGRSNPLEWILAYGPSAPFLALAAPLILKAPLEVRATALTPACRRIALALASWGFVMALLCEAVYVRDLFESTPLARMNTVFKVHRFAWLLMALASAVGMERLFEVGAKRAEGFGTTGERFFFGLRWGRAVVILVLASALVYPVCGTAAWLKARAHEATHPAQDAVRAALRPGADAEALFRALRPGDAGAASFLQRSAGPHDVLIEETGEPYTWSSRVATFSGVPSILGWGNHEAIWRGHWDEVQSRQADIAAVYAHPESRKACDTMRRLGVTWIVAGDLERQRYGPSVDEFRGLARPVFAYSGTEIYAFDALCTMRRR